MSRTRRVGLTLAVLSVCFALAVLPAQAITRGEVIGAIVESLELPAWGGGIRYPDVRPSHPQARAIETASAMGIILPTDWFYPDLEATAAETLCLALRALGLRAEAEIYAGLFPLPERNIPTYLEPYLALAAEMTPAPPERLVRAPREDLDRAGLNELRSWLRRCRMGLRWEKEVREGPYRLILHREGLGSPPPAWTVRASEYDLRAEAEQAASHLRGIGFRPFLRENGSAWWVGLGPFDHYASAWQELTRLPGHPAATVLSQEGAPTKALFWAALVTDRSVCPSIRSAGELGGHRLALSELAKVPGTIAAINGGFFGHTGPIGTLRVKGVSSSLPLPHRTAFFWNGSGEAELGTGNLQLYVKRAGKILPIGSVNTPPSRDLALYTPFAGSNAQGLPCDTLEVGVKDGRVISKQRWGVSLHRIPEGGSLICGSGPLASQLSDWEIGDEVELIERWADGSRADFPYALQAGPKLLEGGKALFVNEGFGKAFSDMRHPRTLVGIGEKEIWWIAVDGRDSWHSRGMTLDEAKRFLLNLGLDEGLNLDGGGSTSLWWKGSLANHPPGGKERPLPYAVVFGTASP